MTPDKDLAARLARLPKRFFSEPRHHDKGEKLLEIVYADPGNNGFYYREQKYDSVTAYVRLDLLSQLITRAEADAMVAAEERSHNQTIDERDLAQGWADKLAAAIGGEEIGEHSNINNPWANALEIAENVMALKAENAELKRKLGGGCDAANGGDHVVIIEGKGRSKYAFCANCGESMVGIRYNHEPRAAQPAAVTGGE